MLKNNRMLLWLALSAAFLPSTKAKQRPKYSEIPFTNVTHRTNLCSLSKDYVMGTIELSDALKGLHLSVGINDNGEELAKWNDEGGLDVEKPGLLPILLDELASRAGFTWRNSYGKVLAPSHELNKGREIDEVPVTWTHILQDATDRYDIAFAQWAQSLERRQMGIGFTTGWFDASIILIQASRYKKPIFSVTNFLKPFSYTVWAMILGIILFSGVVYWWMDVTISGDMRRINDTDLFFPAMAFTQHHLEWNPDSYSQRIFSFSISFWALIMASAYTANLASFLVAKDQPAFVDMTLDRANLQGVPVCVRRGAVEETYAKEKYPNMNFVFGVSFTDTYQLLRDGKCLIMATRASDWDAYQRSAEVNADCTLQWIGRAESVIAAGTAHKIDVGKYCTSLAMHVVDIYMNEMIADGFVKEAWTNYVESLATNKCLKSDASTIDEASKSSSLRPIDVGGIFVVHGFICLVAIVNILFEKRRKKRKTVKMESSKKLDQTSQRDGNFLTSFAGSEILEDRDVLRRAFDSLDAADQITCEKDATVVYEIRRISTFTQRNAHVTSDPCAEAESSVTASMAEQDHYA